MMGQLIDGTWQSGWYSGDAKGAFQRPPTRFRTRSPPSRPGATTCMPRTPARGRTARLITRALRGLTSAIGVTIVDPQHGRRRLGVPRRPGSDRRRGVPARRLRARGPALHGARHRTRAVGSQGEHDRQQRVARESCACSTWTSRRPRAARRSRPSRFAAAIDAALDPSTTRSTTACTARASRRSRARTRTRCARCSRRSTSARPRSRASRTCAAIHMTEADIALLHRRACRFDLVYYSHFKCNLRALRELAAPVALHAAHVPAPADPAHLPPRRHQDALLLSQTR